MSAPIDDLLEAPSAVVVAEVKGGIGIKIADRHLILDGTSGVDADLLLCARAEHALESTGVSVISTAGPTSVVVGGALAVRLTAAEASVGGGAADEREDAGELHDGGGWLIETCFDGKMVVMFGMMREGRLFEMSLGMDVSFIDFAIVLNLPNRQYILM